MAESVIVFDEAHLMPVQFLQPCLRGISYITRFLHSEAIFLTATMPDFKQIISQYTIVEYKPTAPKEFDVREDDALQIFAQKICVDSIFSTNCRAEIYYADTKKRVKLPFDTEYEAYNEKLLNTLQAMQKYKEAGQIPRVQAGQICNGCSMKDICIPSTFKKKFKLKDSIIKFAEDEL
jgi:CRISPR-associated exonuclease Cas4